MGLIVDQYGRNVDENVPRGGTNPLDGKVPESDPLFGEYVEHGKCRVCGAPRWINDTKASLVVRPQIIYTCENRACPGRMYDDPYWQPTVFSLGNGNV